MAVVVFDLDDTLYDEMSYVIGGLRAVAAYLSMQYELDGETVLAQLRDALTEHGRGSVFDAVLSAYGLFSKTRVRKCVSVYRSHEPHLELFPDAERCLRRLRAYPLYIVTDGNKLVQNRKLHALGLHRRVRRALITHRHGVANAKPSPHCFRLIAQLESRRPEEIIYVADDPSKDFVGLRPLGFRTARVMRGRHAHVKAKPPYDADVTWDNLDELTRQLLQSL